jgi:hypothetical protein
MSMNIAFEASREIQVVKTGKLDTQTSVFSVWQTPTEVTNQIARADDPIQAYKDWVMADEGCVHTQLIFAEDDLLEEGEPVGEETVDPRVGHLAELDQWLRVMAQGGWAVKPIIL